ncbi:aminotransferase class III-fold pyridoxal phosphate-dependent enzyme [Bradyrhizobium sp. RDI18]
MLSSARGALVQDVDGAAFIDLMSQGDTLNYGHNHPKLKSAAMEYPAY